MAKAQLKEEPKYRGGRKPLPEGEKKVHVNLYLKKDWVDGLGGVDELQALLTKLTEREYNKKKPGK